MTLAKAEAVGRLVDLAHAFLTRTLPAKSVVAFETRLDYLDAIAEVLQPSPRQTALQRFANAIPIQPFTMGGGSIRVGASLRAAFLRMCAVAVKLKEDEV